MQGYNKWFPYGMGTKEKEAGKVFCFHHAGGNASAFRSWTMKNFQVSFVPVELPGHGRRISEPYATDMDSLSEEIAEEIYCNWGGEPIGLFGHSMGAALAFKTAWHLEQKYHLFPELLVVAGRHAPHLPDPVEFRSEMDDEALIRELIRMKGTPKEILENREFLNFLLPMIRQDYQLHEQFLYNNEVIKTPIEAHAGQGDQDAPEPLVQQWERMTEGDFSFREFPGEHFFPFEGGTQYPLQLVRIFEEWSAGTACCLPCNVSRNKKEWA